jgi:hypothetical protein
MKIMNMIIINGKTIKQNNYEVEDWQSAELLVRSESCWYNIDTTFVVKDLLTNIVSVFKKIITTNSTTDYDIVELKENDCFDYIFI